MTRLENFKSGVTVAVLIFRMEEWVNQFDEEVHKLTSGDHDITFATQLEKVMLLKNSSVRCPKSTAR